MNDQIKVKYEAWLHEQSISDIEKVELLSLKEPDIIDRFGSELEFGTAGIRGVMGVGTNRMNKYVVRKTTQGLANYLKKTAKNPCVAIGYDSRNNSEAFAKEAAAVLASNSIPVYIFSELAPVPMLSYAVRKLSCTAGIVITASHNPKQYNGYKVYNSDGCQLNIEDANKVLDEIKKLDIFKDVIITSFIESLMNGFIAYVPKMVIEDYYKSVCSQSLLGNNSPKTLRIAYSPLHGSGLKPVTNVLKMDGFQTVDIVEEQKLPDGNFTTCPYPNPETKEAMELGTKLLLSNNDDILIATDPDADRVGVVVNHNGEAMGLTGNEVGILLFDFIVNVRKQTQTLPNNPVVVKTIVSSDLVKLIANKHNVNVIDVLTGFKFIGEQIKLLETKREQNRFLLGFEESCGYLTNTNVRDKDAINAVLLVSEMANYYKNKNRTLIDRLNEIYLEYGDYKTLTLNYEFPGEEGKQKIQELMSAFRNPEIQKTLGNVDYIGDYKLQKLIKNGKETPTNLPSSDVVKIFLSNFETVTIRPSGTEPKIKAYIFAKGNLRVKELKDKIDEIMK